MKEFLFNYGWIILVVAGAAAYFYIVYKKRGKEAAIKEARILAYKLMLAAEKEVKGTGRDKFQYVIDRFYLMLPESLKFFISEDEIETFIQDSYNVFKKELSKEIQ